MNTRNNGGSTDYYDLPPKATTLSDLIEHKKMEHGIGEMFKATYALKERAERTSDANSSEIRELNKIIWFANRRITQLGGNVIKSKLVINGNNNNLDSIC
jgi:hypothetical protein